jgi:hypothetical protein
MIYKTIKLLELILNDYIKNRIMPVLLIILPVAQLFSQVMVLRFHYKIPFEAFIIYLLVLVNSLAINWGVFTMISWIIKRSNKILIILKIHSSRIKCGKKVIQMEIRACQRIKIQYGSNFIDRCTPLRVQRNCLHFFKLLISKTKSK